MLPQLADIGAQDFVVIGVLAFLEGILSIDNALVLALLAKGLAPHQRRRALTYGLVGAVVFRLAALSVVSQLMRWAWVKLVGGAYLVFIAVRHFWIEAGKKDSHGVEGKPKHRGFWATVAIIELTDLAFAVDSILAAIALSPKLWVVFLGGILGVVAMRFAATIFIEMIDRFPSLETTAFALVLLIGLKVILEGLKLPGIDFHDHASAPFWVFWALMIGAIGYGFLKRSNKSKTSKAPVHANADKNLIKSLK